MDLPDAHGNPSPGPRGLLSLVPSAFLPALVYEVGNGAIAPIIVLSASRMGASVGTAAFMLVLLGVGRVLGDIPASVLADRVGDRTSMILSAILALMAFFACMAASSLPVLGLALIVVGMSNASFYLARHSYLIEVAPVKLRARAMSSLAGAHRIGLFIGPLAGAGAIMLIGLRGGYVVAMAAAAATAALLLVVGDVEAPGDQPVSTRGGITSYRTLIDHRRLFATLGLAILAVGAVRAARQTVLPLWGDHLGLSAEAISLVFAIAGAVDMALFYPAGKVMDEYGRLAIALPAMVILGGAMMTLPLTIGMVSLTIVAMVMSLGNGIGSGIMMTLGADAAPAQNRVRFLGIWRLVSDSGNAAGPIVVSVVATVWSLAAGIVAIGSAGLLAAIAFAVWVPRYSPYATPKAARADRDAP